MAHYSKQEEMKRKWAEIVTRAWSDPTFKKRLLANPDQVLKENGIAIPNMHFEITEDTKNKIYLSLPQPPRQNLSEEDLKNLSAAGNHGFDVY